MNTSSSLMARIFVRSHNMPMLLPNGKESESVHRKGVKMRLIVSLAVWWDSGMFSVPTSGVTVAHSHRKLPHFGSQ